MPCQHKIVQLKIESMGIVGVGRMGRAFAEILLANGLRIVSYDRNPDRAQLPVARSATAVVQLAALASCQTVTTSLSDDDVLAEVALAPGGLVNVLPRGAIHVSMSKVSRDLSRRLAGNHDAHGQGYVGAPVLANPDPIGAKWLFVLVAGPSEAVESVRPLLERLGQRIFVIGEDAGLASVMKLAGKLLTAATLQSMDESSPCCARRVPDSMSPSTS
jgi:3-hydroxyisobutyrate dehydrogenase-like beta-hydroxyacid dehydrogenase